MTDPYPCARLRPLIVAVAVFFMLLLLVAPLVAAALALATAPLGIGISIAVGAALFVGVMGYLMSSSLQWVELGDGVIRGRRLLTRRVVEYRVADLLDAKPIDTDALGPLQNAILDALLDTTNRGYQLSFDGGRRLALIRADMSGIDPFLGALAEQLRAIREGRSAG